MPGFESSRRIRWISATNSDRKSRFEYDLDRILAGGRSNRISLLSVSCFRVRVGDSNEIVDIKIEHEHPLNCHSKF